jgi:ureidoacrylate peracid hydrolase
MTDGGKSVPWRIKSEKCALLVIDMQNDFLKPGGVLYYNDAPMEAVPNIKRLIDGCRGRSIPVIYTKTLLKDTFDISPLEVSCQPVLMRRGLRDGTWGAEIIDGLEPLPDEPIVLKHRYDAFYNTNLDVILRNIRGMGAVDTVLITGTVTNVCCESTARAAFMRDYKVVFVGDGCGAFDEDAHRATLCNIGRFFGRVMDTQSLLKALDEGEDSLTSFLE